MLVQKATSLTVQDQHSSQAPATNGIKDKIYGAWFAANKCFIETTRKYGFVAIGVTLGMLFTEGHTLVRAGWHTLVKYKKDPKEYGFNQLTDEHKDQRPVIILHGAAGSWNYAGDMAKSIKDSGRPVYVINFGGGAPTEAKRLKLHNEIARIQREYQKKFGTATKVDLVAHSMGAALAVASAFSAKTSHIDDEGDFQLDALRQWEAQEGVGKVITVANPSNSEEVRRMELVGKGGDLYNVNAQFDALMGHKTCGLVGERAHQACEISAGHVGIVYVEAAVEKVIEILQK